MKKGLDKVLEDFEMEFNQRVTENVSWSDITRKGEHYEVVTPKKAYKGYKLGNTFYYLENSSVKSIDVAKIKKGTLKRVNEGVYKNTVNKKMNTSAIKGAVNFYLNQIARKDSPESEKIIAKASKSFNIEPDILRQELKEIGAFNNLEESENKKKRPDRGKPRSLKMTRAMPLLQTITKDPYYNTVEMHGISDGFVALIRDEKEGEAYEVTVKPSYYGEYFQDKRGIEESSHDVSIGIKEIAEFFKSASPEEVDQFERYCDIGDLDKAQECINDKIGIKEKYADMDSKPEDYLDGDEFVG